MLTIAYYSAGTPYEEEAALLRASLDRVGMAHAITGVPDRGGWYANTAWKASFIRDQRTRRSGPLLYVDVDAFVHQNCTGYFDGLEAQGVDFGAHWFRGPAKGHDQRKLRPEGHRMLSGTLFLGDTPGCRRLLDAWVGLNALLTAHGCQKGGGQKNLWYLTTCLPGLKIQRLPGRFCRVFDKAWAYDPQEPVIIEHTIASRQRRPNTGDPDAVCARDNHKRQERIGQLRERVAT